MSDKDVIYRHQAIDAINALHEKPNAWLDSAVDAVMSLPSAQYSDAYKAGFNKGYEKAKKEMERQVFVTSDGKVHTITTTWLGDFSPYTCKHCGFHVDSKTKYCPECGRKAVNNVDESDRGKSE